MNRKTEFALIVLVIFLSLFWLAFAWQEPASSPPGGGGALQTDTNGNLLLTSNKTVVQGELEALSTATFSKDLLVKENLTLGCSSAPKGITLYDASTSALYCLRIYEGVLGIEPGSCQNILTNTCP